MMHDRDITAHGQCERSRRTAGFLRSGAAASAISGPCRFGIGEPEPVPFEFTNRLHGAVINARGEAI
jgi:hypothetical protein